MIITKILGWDVRPLMAAGGFSGIVLGLATQSVLANALAGLQLVSSIPVSRSPSRLHPEPCHACTSLPYTLCSKSLAHNDGGKPTVTRANSTQEGWLKQPRALQVIVRPLVVGERVTLSGAVNVTGVVEQLDFLQTVLRTDTHIPYTLPNKVSQS